MKQEFEMAQEEMDKILDINKNASNTVMMVGGVDFSHSLTDAINAYWEILGKKYGFKPSTVEASSKGKLFFLAITVESKSVIPPSPKERLISVLCDADGKVCIEGSDEDKNIVQKALDELSNS